MATLRITNAALVGGMWLALGIAAGAEYPEATAQTEQVAPGAAGSTLPTPDVPPVPVRPRELAVPPGQRDLTGVPAGAARAGRWNFSARVVGELTLSSNINLAPPGRESSDAVFGLSTPIGVRRAGPRSLVLAEYVPTVYTYAQNSDANYVQNNLRSFMSLEAVNDLLFVDALAHSYPLYVSPFLPRPDSGALITQNRAQRTTLGVSPYLRHETARGWSYLLRNDNFWNAFSDSALSDTAANRVSATLESPPTRFNFGLDYTYLYTRYQAEPTGYYQQAGIVRPTLRATRNLSASVRLGYESNDYFVPAYSDAVYGAGFAWTPNPRTKLDGFLDHRFFGASYEVNLSYRTRRTVWRVRGSRNTITPLDQPLSQRPITTAELLDQAFRARIADPTERERVVRQFLDSAGLPASLTQPYSFYAPTIYVSEQWSGSVGLLGRRNTADLTLFWQDNTPLASVGLTPASAFAYDPFRQLGVALNFTHRISRLTSVTLGASRFQTKRTGTAALAQDTLTQDTGRVGLTHQLGPKTEFTVALRWLRFDSVTDPYRERAVLVALAHSF